MICNKCGAECVENTKYCASCGELLETEPAQSVVPEFTNTTVNNSQKSGDGYAITSMILGIASFFFCSLITGILAIVLVKRQKQMVRTTLWQQPV